jgi:hypothetical protein
VSGSYCERPPEEKKRSFHPLLKVLERREDRGGRREREERRKRGERREKGEERKGESRRGRLTLDFGALFCQ